MKSIMICLIGEQPVPNLLPIRHCVPKEVVLVYTKTSERVKNNIAKVLENCRLHEKEVSPYNLTEVEIELRNYLIEKGWDSDDLIFNLTGGTKPMSLATFRLAESLKSELVYLQSEGGKGLLYSYNFIDNELKFKNREEIISILTIDEYLKVHGLDYNIKQKSELFEDLVFESLESHVCEIVKNICIGSSLEIDLLIRCGNQLAIAEVKTGKSAERKTAIDQLNTASQREFLGIYTKRFLILDRELGTNNSELAKAHNIQTIELLDEWKNGKLSDSNKKQLIDVVSKTLNCKPNPAKNV